MGHGDSITITERVQTHITMKFIGLTALLSGAVYSAAPHADFEWLAWKQQHGVTFKTRQEEAARYSVFGENRKFIAAHNLRAANGQETYTVALNKYKYMGQTRDYNEKKIVLEYS